MMTVSVFHFFFFFFYGVIGERIENENEERKALVLLGWISIFSGLKQFLSEVLTKTNTTKITLNMKTKR